MSKKNKSAVRKIFFSGIRPSSWIGTDNMKRGGRVVKETYSLLNTTTAESLGKRDFKKEMEDSGVTEADLYYRMKKRRQFALGYLLFFLIGAGYSAYLIMSGLVFVSLQSGAISLIMLLFALREHYLLYQLKHKTFKVKLGDWLGSVLRGDW